MVTSETFWQLRTQSDITGGDSSDATRPQPQPRQLPPAIVLPETERRTKPTEADKVRFTQPPNEITEKPKRPTQWDRPVKIPKKDPTSPQNNTHEHIIAQ